MDLNLYWGKPNDTSNNPTGDDKCYFWVKYRLNLTCELVDSNEEGFVRPVDAPDMTAVLTGSTLGELYNGPAHLIPIKWPAKNGETYTVEVNENAGPYEGGCASQTKTLEIPEDACPCPADSCLYGPAVWTLVLSLADEGTHIANPALGNFSQITTYMDARALNHSKSVPLVINEYADDFGNMCPFVQTPAQYYFIGTVTTECKAYQGATLRITSTASYDVYGLITDTLGSALATFPPTVSGFAEPKVVFVARCTAWSVGSYFTSGETWYVRPYFFFDIQNPTTVFPTSRLNTYISLYPTRRAIGTCSTGSGQLVNNYTPRWCECLCTGVDHATFRWAPDISGLRATIPSGSRTIGVDQTFDNETQIESFWNGLTNGGTLVNCS